MAIPPGYARYATVVAPDNEAQRTRSDAALLKASVYTGWPYVLLKGGAEQALGWRRNADATPWHSALPELLFPADRSWLVSTLWDDDWRCVGGSAALIEALLHDPDLDTRAVTGEEDATPPGHLPR